MAQKPRTRESRKAAPAAAPAAPPSKSTPIVLAVALALITIAIYAQVASHQYISLDDPGYILENAHVTTGLNAGNVRWALTSGYAANWHPLTWISHQIDVSLFGMTPGSASSDESRLARRSPRCCSSACCAP